MSDGAVIRLISNNFVPVALNRHEISAAKGAGGDFFRLVYNKTNSIQYQGLWLVTSDGEVLATAFGEGLEVAPGRGWSWRECKGA